MGLVERPDVSFLKMPVFSLAVLPLVLLFSWLPAVVAKPLKL
jgi:hypothetical protein